MHLPREAFTGVNVMNFIHGIARKTNVAAQFMDEEKHMEEDTNNWTGKTISMLVGDKIKLTVK